MCSMFGKFLFFIRYLLLMMIDGVLLIWLCWVNCLVELVLVFIVKLFMVVVNCFGLML